MARMKVQVRVIEFPDERWSQMYQIWINCRKAQVEPPDEVVQFFNYKDPNPEGRVRKITAENIQTEKLLYGAESTTAHRGYRLSHHQGGHIHRIDLDSLGKDVKYLEFQVDLKQDSADYKGIKS